MLVELLIVFKSSRMPHVCGLVLIFTFFYVFSPMINSLRCSQVFIITFEEAFLLFSLTIFLQNSRLFFNRFRCKGFIEDSVSKFSKWRCSSVYSQTIFLHLRLKFWTWRQSRLHYSIFALFSFQKLVRIHNSFRVLCFILVIYKRDLVCRQRNFVSLWSLNI